MARRRLRANTSMRFGGGQTQLDEGAHPPRPRIPIRPLDERARAAAAARQAQLIKPAGSLGRLEDLVVWFAACTGEERPVMRARVIVAAADHGVTAEGVSAYPPEVTAQMLAAFLTGRGAVAVLARELGAELQLVDAGVAGPVPDDPSIVRVGLPAPSRNLAIEPALTTTEVALAVDAGRGLAAAAG